MASLSDLIFGSQQSNENVEERTAEETNENEQRSYSTVKERYTFDPIQDFYEQQTQTQTQPSRSQAKAQTATKPPVKRTRFKTEYNQPSSQGSASTSASTPTPTPTSTSTSISAIKRYDFQQNVDDREFYAAPPKRKAITHKWKRMSYTERENETEEERSKRLKAKARVKARRKRFRNLKYNFANEVDYGDSVLNMVKLKMDANDGFQKVMSLKMENSPGGGKAGDDGTKKRKRNNVLDAQDGTESSSSEEESSIENLDAARQNNEGEQD